MRRAARDRWCCAQDVTNAITTAGSKGLAKYGETCTHELNKIVELVRGTLTKLQRATCGALVVIDVHARDVTLQMAEQRVESVRDFKWESQLRCTSLPSCSLPFARSVSNIKVCKPVCH